MKTNKITPKKGTRQSTRLKALPPTLREKARYVAFEILSQSPLQGNASKDLVAGINSSLGVRHAAEAGVMTLRYDERTQNGILRTNSKGLQDVKAAFAMTYSLQGTPCIVRSIKTSGTLNKVKNNQSGTNQKR